MEELTPRESEILRMIASFQTDGGKAYGLSNAQIAERLGISKRTVDNHVDNIKTKLNAPNRVALVSIFVRTGGVL